MFAESAVSALTADIVGLSAVPPFLSSWVDWLTIREKLNKSSRNCKKKKRKRTRHTYSSHPNKMREDKLVFDVSVEDLTESESDDESVANNEVKYI